MVKFGQSGVPIMQMYIISPRRRRYKRSSPTQLDGQMETLIFLSDWWPAYIVTSTRVSCRPPISESTRLRGSVSVKHGPLERTVEELLFASKLYQNPSHAWANSFSIIGFASKAWVGWDDQMLGHSHTNPCSLVSELIVHKKSFSI
jgi:hypothetical protein